MRPAADIYQALEAAGDLMDHDVSLEGVALLLAALDRPDVALDPYRRHLHVLGQEVGHFLLGLGEPPDIGEQANALQQVLHARYGYVGTEEAFYDPEGANLTRVIDRRCGLPVALGIIYLVVARAQGWSVSGLDFPGRFLIRLHHQGERMILDPFAGGAILTVPDLRDMLKAFSGTQAELLPRHYRNLPDRQVLVRLQGNVRGRLLREGRLEEAIQIIESTLLFAPKEAALWRECGLLHARLDNLPDAISALEQFLQFGSDLDTRYGTSVFLQDLRQRLNEA